MSILIKGMEMPTSCAKCKLFGEYGCPFIGAVGYALVRGERNEDCPLIPIQPHGRLGDLDELYSSLKKWLIQNRHSMTEATRVWIRGVLEGIAAAPTIIEEER